MNLWIDEDQPLPPPEAALGHDTDAPGLLAITRSLDAARLQQAYLQGIFPWYGENMPVLWWSTDPRMVLYTSEFKISPSLQKTLRKVARDTRWEVRMDHDFAAVMRACAAPREGHDGTWINQDIIAGYCALHAQGMAHSVETWFDGELVGGAYGVALGRMFYGESMFARKSDASKIALAHLVDFLQKHDVKMIDCQQETAHLASLGARPIARAEFLQHLRAAVQLAPIAEWRLPSHIAGQP
ncbi:leucyl/phenylalanyl-tRNA--protein transferase [Massilia sp. W12]|uniref:leucyl/phenylalanyl-tRNA--protein transferase n=1 Tax=Massilia sp. W12 TaxID=3126507 RepID=UPI0030CD474F